MFMKDSVRLGATFIVWTALTIILTSSQTSLEGIFAVFAILAGMGATIAVWQSGGSAAQLPNKDTTEKAKRNARDHMTRLVQQMDDTELAQLSDLLSQNDDSAGYNERLSR
jgi:hypothetical protein